MRAALVALMLVTVALGVWLFWPTATQCDLVTESTIALECGYIEVPADHNRADSPPLQVPYLWLKSDIGSAEHAVLIPGGGGPGSSLGLGEGYSAQALAGQTTAFLAAGIDVVMVEQRGVGVAKPDGSCTELLPVMADLADETLAPLDEVDRVLPALAICREEMALGGLNPAWFNTEQSASDVLLMMQSFPHQRWHLLATSYATLLAERLLARAPERFAGAVMDSMVSRDEGITPTTSLEVRAAIQAVIDACVNDKPCARRYPELRSDYQRLMATLEAEPARLQVDFRYGGQHVSELAVTPMVARDVLFTGAYWTEGIAALPRTITAAADGDWSRFIRLADDLYWQYLDPQFGDVLSNTIYCTEDLPVEQRFLRANADYVARLSQTDIDLIRASERLCAHWLTPSALIPQLPHIAVPTLMLVGGLDPITPAVHAQLASVRYRDVGIVIDPTAGHAPYYASDCAARYALDFVVSGIAPDDTQCLPTPIRWD